MEVCSGVMIGGPLLPFAVRDYTQVGLSIWRISDSNPMRLQARGEPRSGGSDEDNGGGRLVRDRDWSWNVGVSHIAKQDRGG